MALSPYYYGVQRKALTGTSYGPYYGKRYMRGPEQGETTRVGTQPGITELSERYATEPTAEYATEPAISTFTPTPAIRPAISGGYRGAEEAGGETSPMTGLTGQMTPGGWKTVGWALGLSSTPPQGFPQPIGGYKTAGQIGKVTAGALTTNPLTGMIYNYGKLLVDQFLSTVLPSLYSLESLTTTEEAARGAKQSMDYASFGMFGTPVTGPHVTSAQEEADAAAANAATGVGVSDYGGWGTAESFGPSYGGEGEGTGFGDGGGYGGGGYGGESSGEGGPL